MVTQELYVVQGLRGAGNTKYGSAEPRITQRRCYTPLEQVSVETEKEARQVVRFGIFDLDLRARSLHKAGIRVKLQAQPFAILVLLISRRGEVVTRDELQRKLWPTDTFVDFEHSVNTAVMRLRDALGDSAESPRFIETVPRHGYRFIAPAEWPAEIDSPPCRGSAGVPSSRRAKEKKSPSALLDRRFDHHAARLDHRAARLPWLA